MMHVGDHLAPSFGLIGATDDTHFDTRNPLVVDLVCCQAFWPALA